MDEQRLEEIYRLVRENNKMLHAQRRGAFIGGLLKVLFYIAIAGVSFWSYTHYLAPVLQSALKTAEQMQNAGGQVQAQFGGAGDSLKPLIEQLQKILPKQQ